jgi:hypothetical protein
LIPTLHNLSKQRNWMIMGQRNGVVRIQPMSDTKLIEDAKSYWSYGFHDNEYGQITNLCLSYDEKYLFSVGADSNIFGTAFNSPTPVDVSLEQAKQAAMQAQAKLTPKVGNLLACV